MGALVRLTDGALRTRLGNCEGGHRIRSTWFDTEGRRTGGALGSHLQRARRDPPSRGMPTREWVQSKPCAFLPFPSLPFSHPRPKGKDPRIPNGFEPREGVPPPRGIPSSVLPPSRGVDFPRPYGMGPWGHKGRVDSDEAGAQTRHTPTRSEDARDAGFDWETHDPRAGMQEDTCDEQGSEPIRQPRQTGTAHEVDPSGVDGAEKRNDARDPFGSGLPVADALQNQHSTGYTNFTSFNPGEQAAMAKRAGAMWQVDKVQELVSTAPVVVYSKSWCPFCMQVKGLFEKLGVQAEVVEMDGMTEENEIMDALVELTGQSTVPNVFIGGQHVGGCDDAMQLHSEGKLEGMLKEAGALSA